MNQFQRYLLDELVDDYREGRMSRRENRGLLPGFLANADPQRHVDDATGAGAFLQQQDGVRSDAHGITDTGDRYDKAAATDAWARALAWSRQYLPAG